MRYFFGLNARAYQYINAFSPCCERGYGYNPRTGTGPYGFPTGALYVTEYSPQLVGGSYAYFEWRRVHAQLTTGGTMMNYITRLALDIRTTAPWTTGMVSVSLSGVPYVSTAVQTGYDNRTENREMGTLSLVVPWLTHRYLTALNPLDPVTSPFHNARIRRMNVTFLPEPVGILLLSAGILGLVGAYRLRRR